MYTATLTPTTAPAAVPAAPPAITPDTPPAGEPGHTRSASNRQSTRLAGIGALTFVAVVVLQNIVRGSSAPGNDASASEVLDHFADTRGITFLLVCTFVVSGVSLATFLGGTMRRLAASTRPGWAGTGYLGGAGILILFGVLVASEQALSVLASGDRPDLAAISALWALHNSVFTVLLLFLGIALFGLSRAGVAAGITPRVFGWLAPVGSVTLAIACAAGPGIAAGELGGLFGLGLVGFVVWLAFLTATGIRLVRNTEVAS